MTPVLCPSRALVIATALLLVPMTPLLAQEQAPLGGFTHDASQPVEIAANSLSVNQAEGSATFKGEVLVGQGTLRLSAEEITVVYSGGSGDTAGQISRMLASGGVTLTNGAEAAEAQSAIYDVGTGQVTMTGEVLLTQGGNALSGEELSINLNDGTAQMTGRVRSILQPTQTGQ